MDMRVTKNLRIHSFPWGRRTLHYSPVVNALEVEDPDTPLDAAALAKRFGEAQGDALLGIEGGGATTEPADAETPAQQPLRFVDLVLTHGCSLDCGYCSLYRGRSIAPVGTNRMTWKIAHRAVELLRPSLEAGGNCRIRFTGGEPLLHLSFMYQVMDDALPSYSRGGGRHRLFSLVTNGLALDERVIERLRSYPISIQLSLDGPAEAHDAHRRLRGSRAASHARVQRAAILLKRLTGELNVAAVWTPGGPSVVERVRYFESIGATRLRLTHANLQLTGGPHTDDGTAVFDELTRQYQEYEQHYREQWRRGRIPLYDPYSLPIQRLRGDSRRARSCDPLGTGNRIIDVDGSIYPCYAFVGLREHCLGTVFDGEDPEVLTRWAAKREATQRQCDPCWAWPLCRGADLCDHFPFDSDRADTRALCNYLRTRIETALGLHVDFCEAMEAYAPTAGES